MGSIATGTCKPSLTAAIVRPFASGIDKVAENKIAEWLHNRGDESLDHGREIPKDRHKTLAHSMGLANDYVHSKILADNNIRPESVQRRMDLDKAWDELATSMRNRYADVRRSQTGACMSKEDFVASASIQEEYREALAKLDEMAKRVNAAILEDSMRFNGRSPVAHARRYRLEERLMEAINALDDDDA
jgi:hypothetical protein